MTVREAFEFLNIEPTKDENEIKKAYRSLLVKTNPEEDPEGFKLLRAAFESAQNYARSEEEGLLEDEDDNSPIHGNTVFGIEVSDELLAWSKELFEMNNTRSRRFDEAEWKRLLHADIFMDLEEGDKAQKIFFYFLSIHYNQTSHIYRVIDSITAFSERKDELMEFLPEEFIQYVERRIQDQEGVMDYTYEWFEGNDIADIDLFIHSQYELEEMIASEEFDQARLQIQKMEEMGISHPYFVVEKMKLALKDERNEEVIQNARKLHHKYSDNVRMLVTSADLLYRAGQKEEAIQIFESLDKDKFSNLPQYRLAEYQMELGNYTKAIAHCCKVLDYYYDPMLFEMADRIYHKVYDEYIALGEAIQQISSLSEEQMEALLDAFLYLKLNQDGIDFVNANRSKLSGKAFAHRYLGRFYFYLKDYENAMEGCQKWRSYVEEMEASEEKKRLFARTYSYESQIYMQMAEDIGKGRNIDERIKQKDLWYKAEQTIREALNIHSTLIYKRTLAKTLMGQERGEQAVEILKACMEENPRDYHTLLLLQEAHECARDAQGIIDVLRRFTQDEIYVVEAYEYVASMYIDMNRVEDAKQVLEEAREHELDSPKLKLVDMQIACRSGEAIAVLDLVRSKLEDIIREHQTDPEKMPEEILADAYYEMAVLCDQARLPKPTNGEEERIVYIKHALSHYETLEYCYTYGRFLLYVENYQEALEWLNKAALECENHWRESNIYEHLGFCYASLNDFDKAIECYLKVEKVSPKHDVIHLRLAKAYYSRLRETYCKKYAENAICHLEKQLEIDPASSDAFEYLYHCYMKTRDYEKAYKMVQKLEGKYDDSFVNYMKADALGGLCRFDEAINLLSQNIAIMTNETFAREDFILAGRLCRRKGDPKQAIYWYEAAKSFLLPGDTSMDDRIYDTYCAAGMYQEARQFYLKTHAKMLSRFEQIELLMLDYRFADSQKKRKQIQSKMRMHMGIVTMDKSVWDPARYDVLAKRYLYFLNDERHAKQYFEKAISLALRSEDGLSSLSQDGKVALLHLIEFASKRGDKNAVDLYAKQYMSQIKDGYSFDSQKDFKDYYIEDLYEGMGNLYYLASFYIHTGNLELAKKYIEEMQSRKACDFCQYCSYTECADLYEIMAMLAQAERDEARAHELFKKTYALNYGNDYVMWKLNQLEEKQK